MQGVSDTEILNMFSNPEHREKAFLLLVEKYQRPLYWHCRKILLQHEDTDDAVQNAWIKVWNNLDGFRADSGLYTWIYRIATNEALNLFNQKKRQYHAGSDSEYENYLADQLEADVYFDGDDAERKLQRAILSLPEKQRIVFNMKYFDAMKYEDMAEILETSVGALKASYHHAVKKIESMVKQD